MTFDFVSPSDEIDWTDFTGVPDLPISANNRESLRGKRVLITGAGGSIGGALSRALAYECGSELLLVDQSELGLHALSQSLHNAPSGTQARLALGSVTDSSFVEELFLHFRPEIVFHAAAHKHLPLLETNAIAAATTNILGTQLIVQASSARGAEQCILLSTDKAVEPTSIMGVTKRIAECLLLTEDSSTEMKVLRLGNVLGSSGSVAPTFLDQLRDGQLLTVSHENANRYFLTLSQAVTYLVGCASSARTSGLFVPILGCPRRVADLAQFLLDRAGLKGSQSRMIFSGLRPGEKVGERLVALDEAAESPTGEESLQKVKTPLPPCAELNECLAMVCEAVRERDLRLLLKAFHLLVPQYRPSDLVTMQLGIGGESSLL